jgi:hypothetical protein
VGSKEISRPSCSSWNLDGWSWKGTYYLTGIFQIVSTTSIFIFPAPKFKDVFLISIIKMLSDSIFR